MPCMKDRPSCSFLSFLRLLSKADFRIRDLTRNNSWNHIRAKRASILVVIPFKNSEQEAMSSSLIWSFRPPAQIAVRNYSRLRFKGIAKARIPSIYFSICKAIPCSIHTVGSQNEIYFVPFLKGFRDL